MQLAVYDSLGRELAVLVNGNRPAGLHSVRFDAGQLAGGVYFLQTAFQRRNADRENDAHEVAFCR